MKCFSCDGVAHPDTGHAWTPTAIVCRSCFLDFFAWYRPRMHNPIAITALADLAKKESLSTYFKEDDDEPK